MRLDIYAKNDDRRCEREREWHRGTHERRRLSGTDRRSEIYLLEFPDQSENDAPNRRCKTLPGRTASAVRAHQTAPEAAEELGAPAPGP